MQIILVGAAIVNQIVTGEKGTTLVLIGLHCLQRGAGPSTGGQGGGEPRCPPEDAEGHRPLSGATASRSRSTLADLVPGDIVLFEAGQPRAGGRPIDRGRQARDRRVGADGREHAGLEGQVAVVAR